MVLKRGFTLVEMAVVLVVIGLLVGGVLAGDAVIQAAKVRKQISQIDQIEKGAAAFRMKYDYLPGDIPAPQAQRFGFFAETTLAGTCGHQDGNGFIQSDSCSYYAQGETLSFWRHLTEAQLIEGNYGTTSSGSPLSVTTGQLPATLTSITAGQAFPRSAISDKAYLIIYAVRYNVSEEFKNYLQITSFINVYASVGSTFYFSSSYANLGVTPIQAFNIDLKADDGAPSTGIVRAMQETEFPNQPATSGNGCILSTNYDVRSGNSNLPYCQLRFEAGF